MSLLLTLQEALRVQAVPRTKQGPGDIDSSSGDEDRQRGGEAGGAAALGSLQPPQHLPAAGHAAWDGHLWVGTIGMFSAAWELQAGGRGVVVMALRGNLLHERLQAEV